MKVRHLESASYDIEVSLLAHGAHTEVGRVLPPYDTAHDAISEAISRKGEQVWYTPAGDEVELRGLLLHLDESDRDALKNVSPAATAAIYWVALNSEDSETETAVHVLTENEYQQMRRDVPSAVIADIVAADDRERTGRPRDGESLEDAARRLAELMRR